MSSPKKMMCESLCTALSCSQDTSSHAHGFNPKRFFIISSIVPLLIGRSLLPDIFIGVFGWVQMQELYLKVVQMLVVELYLMLVVELYLMLVVELYLMLVVELYLMLVQNLEKNHCNNYLTPSR